jgi:hypothetical protein
LHEANNTILTHASEIRWFTLFDKIFVGLDMVPPFFKWNINSKRIQRTEECRFAAGNDRCQFIERHVRKNRLAGGKNLQMVLRSFA